MPEYKPTMTCTELCNDLRACGVKMSIPKLRAMILQGKFSEFAEGVMLKKAVFTIWRKKYEKWKVDHELHYIY